MTIKVIAVDHQSSVDGFIYSVRLSTSEFVIDWPRISEWLIYHEITHRCTFDAYTAWRTTMVTILLTNESDAVEFRLKFEDSDPV